MRQLQFRPVTAQGHLCRVRDGTGGCDGGRGEGAGGGGYRGPGRGVGGRGWWWFQERNIGKIVERERGQMILKVLAFPDHFFSQEVENIKRSSQ